MTKDELKKAILDALIAVAPEMDEASVRADQPLRDQLDIDSFDFLRFVIGLNERLGVEVPEADYSKLVTLDDIVRYLDSLRAAPLRS